MAESNILQFPPRLAVDSPERDTAAKVFSLPTPDTPHSEPDRRYLQIMPLRHLVAADYLQDDDGAEPPYENVLSPEMTLGQFQMLLFDFENQNDMLAARRERKFDAHDPELMQVMRDQFVEEIDTLDYRLLVRSFEEADLADGTRVSIARPEEHVRVLQLSGSVPDQPVITLMHTTLTAEGDSKVEAKLYFNRLAFENFPERGLSFEVQGQSMLNSLLRQIRLLNVRLCRDFFDEER